MYCISYYNALLIRELGTGITNFYKSSSPQTDNFIRLLSCEGKDTINVLVRFLKLAYRIRKGQSCEKHLINRSFCFQSFNTVMVK